MKTNDPLLPLLEEIMERLIRIDHHLSELRQNPAQRIDGTDVCRKAMNPNIAVIKSTNYRIPCGLYL